MPIGLRIVLLALAMVMLVVPFTGITKTEAEEPVSTPEPTPTAEPIDLDSDLYWLARVMEAEDGLHWTDWQIMMIGEVVLNRVESSHFPNTVKEVVLQEGQYEPFFGGYTLEEPGVMYLHLAKRLMRGERVLCDKNVVWQALFPQGDDTYVTVYDRALNTTTYFCRSYYEEGAT